MQLPKSSGKRLKDVKLRSMLEITKAINNNVSTHELLKLYEDVLKNDLGIEKAVLFGHDEKWQCLLKYGVNNELAEIDVETELMHIKEISTREINTGKGHISMEIIIPVFHKSQPLAYVMIDDIEDKVQLSPTIKHLPFVQTITNLITVAIENKKLAKENLRQAAIKRELELASEMQAMLFPSLLPNNERIEMAAEYLPHQQIGGDYYDYIKLNENEVFFCVADVSGKGIAAALLMSNFQANLRALLPHSDSLSSLVKELNAKVNANAKGEKFITFFLAKYNFTTSTLNYINAGHNPPVIVSKGNVDLLRSGCIGLGILDEIEKIKEGNIKIEGSTVIISYTDGIVELENEDGEEFGLKRFEKLLEKNSKLGMKELNKLILETLNKFKGNRNYIDDIALFSCRIR